MNRMTTDEAVQWLLDNTEWRRSTDISANALTAMRGRFKRGKLKETAKTRLIEKSGMFTRTNYYEFKK